MRSITLSIAIMLGCLVGACSHKEPVAKNAAQPAPPPVVLSTSLRLPAIFGDNMVLQRGIPVPVWGWADAGSTITVTCQNQSKTAVTAPDGRWMARLDPLTGGGPFQLTVASGKSVTYRNVIAGEVWICSGQSNMEWPLRQTTNADEVIAKSANSSIRLFTVKKAQADDPQTDCQGQWQESTPETASSFSGVAYHFGRELNKALNAPVGLIHTSWGGSPIEVWMSREMLLADAEFAKAIDDYNTRLQAFQKNRQKYEQDLKAWEAAAAAAKKENKPVPAKPPQPRLFIWKPTCLYNAMIAPLIPYGIAGAIWYQGESNAGNAALYRRQMPAMIQGWRKDWGQGDFTFCQVSLANFMARKQQPSDSSWAELREAQAVTAATCPKTGQAIAIDIGEEKDIHPKNKEDVGKRLALAALGIGYGKPIVYCGPTYESMKIDGSEIRLRFKNVGGGLVARGEKLTGFAVAGEDRTFVWANAKIDGEDVVISSTGITQPVAVRYAWADNPECNLYNKEGLPAVPFRTDSWPKKQ